MTLATTISDGKTVELTPLHHHDLAQLAFGHLSHDQMAAKVRMLMRGDLDHEPVCSGARDRIKWLAWRVEQLESALAAKDAPATTPALCSDALAGDDLDESEALARFRSNVDVRNADVSARLKSKQAAPAVAMRHRPAADQKWMYTESNPAKQQPLPAGQVEWLFNHPAFDLSILPVVGWLFHDLPADALRDCQHQIQIHEPDSRWAVRQQVVRLCDIKAAMSRFPTGHENTEAWKTEAMRLLVMVFKADDQVVRSMWAQDLQRFLCIGRWAN